MAESDKSARSATYQTLAAMLNANDDLETQKKILARLEQRLPNGQMMMDVIPMGYFMAGRAALVLGEPSARGYFMTSVDACQAGKEVYAYFAKEMEQNDSKRAAALARMSETSQREADMLAMRIRREVVRRKRQR